MMNRSSLAQLAIDAAGGLDRWRRCETVTARLLTGGVLWPLKHQPGVLDGARVRVNLRKAWASHRPFGALKQINAGVLNVGYAEALPVGLRSYSCRGHDSSQIPAAGLRGG